MHKAVFDMCVNCFAVGDQHFVVTPPQQPEFGPAEPANDEPTDAELIARSLDDPRAFMPLVDRHRRVIFGYLARRVGRDLAEDITSETFTRAFALRTRFDQARDDARPWLFGIAANLMRSNARSEVRQLRAYARHGIEDRSFDDHAASDLRIDAAAQTSALAAALAALKLGDREALQMYAWNDMSYEEIAAALEIPVGTVRSRLNRARRIVREHLAAAPDPGPNRQEAAHGRP